MAALAAATLDSKPVERVELTHFVEEVGLMFEAVGLPRMAGRIFGWLLIANPPHQSMGDLVEVLQASKGSISTMTRLLIQISLIERVSFPGQRRDYFQIKPHAWSQLSQQRMTQITAFRKLAERGLDLLADQPLPLQQRLQEMRDMHAFLEREMPLLDQRWQQEQEQRRLTETPESTF
ncbi:MarR family transcriptional regulator [Cyanobacteria bacterium FACHB-471]|nr:MarR family transcriptional regulator [Cyanobacteria bacterium FACHB-471]